MTPPTDARIKRLERDAKIRDLAIAKTPIRKIASIVEMTPDGVRKILNKMVSRGELVRIPNTSPAIYEDPRTRVTSINGGEPKSIVDDGYVEMDVPLMSCLPGSGALPLGWVNRHISGHIAFTVRKKGSFDSVPCGDGVGYCGFWDKPKPAGNGQTAWECHLKLYGQNLSVLYYESTHGKIQFRVHVGRVYVKPKEVDVQRTIDIFLSRANFVAGLLRATGWQVSDPVIKGVVHQGRENDPLADYVTPKLHNDGDDIIVDYSPGCPEIEMEDCSDEEKNQIFANIPGTLKELRHGVAANTAGIAEVRGDMAAMRAHLEELKGLLALNSSVLDEVTQVASKHTVALGGIQTVTTRQTAMLEGLQTVVAMQSTVLARLSDNVTALAEMEAKSISMAAQSATVRFPPFSGVEYQ